MLLRSSSTPILHTWLPTQLKEPSPEPEPLHQLPKIRSLFTLPPSSHSIDGSIKKALSETNLKELCICPKLKVPKNSLTSELTIKEEEERGNGSLLFSSSGLDNDVGGDGGKICGGGGSGSGGGYWGSGSDGGLNGTDVYYKSMIEANPGNPLLLSNYARFLKEVYIAIAIL